MLEAKRKRLLRVRAASEGKCTRCCKRKMKPGRRYCRLCLGQAKERYHARVQAQNSQPSMKGSK